MGLREFTRNKWTRAAFWSVLYVLWVAWLGNWWWIFGLVVVFDACVTKKVNWTFWKKRYKEGEKRDVANDWLDAIIFAVIVVTFINTFFFQAFKIPSSSMESSLYTGDHLFVDKLTWGPRINMTPLTIPFTHNVIFGRESYSTLIQSPYRRLKGFREVRRGDYVVFGFPDGDTVLRKFPAEDYYALVRQTSREYAISNYGPVISRPMDKKDHYVKRCVAVAGDTLEVRDGLVWVNGQQQEVWPGIQLSYTVKTTGQHINSRILEKMGMNTAELWFDPNLPGYPAMPLTATAAEQVAGMSSVAEVKPNIDVYPPDYPETYLSLFPFTSGTGWTRDCYGPIWIPKKGVTVSLTEENLPLYERIIDVYEGHDLTHSGGQIVIDGKVADSYTFGQDYYFMMGDNRHNSLDSRYWGFVPEDHVVGRPAVIWLSTDRNRKFPNNIRWGRFFKFL